MLFNFLDRYYKNLPDELTQQEKHKVLYTIFIRLLKKYPIRDSVEKKINDTVEYYSSIEEFEKCIDLVDAIKNNKLKFNQDESRTN